MRAWHINFRHLRAGLVIDTNLFLLLLVGRYDLAKLASFRATRKYSEEAFRLLESLVSLFTNVYTTPNIVTEVDNLSRQVSKSEWNGISAALAGLVRGLNEEKFGSAELVQNAAHSAVGITDCSIIELANREMLVVTDDLHLTIQLERQRLGVINLSRYLGP